MKSYIKISCLGDIICEKQQLEENYDKKIHNYNFELNFKGIEDFLKKSDYVIANLETPLTYKNENLTYEEYIFNTPLKFAKAIKKCGIDMLTLANNHCLDRGIEGIDETIDCLDKINIDHTGTYKSSNLNISDRVFIKEIKGMKFAILSYTYGTNRDTNKISLNNKNRRKINLFRKQEKIIYKFSIVKRFKRKFLSKYMEEKFNLKRDKKYLKQVREDIEYAKQNSDFVLFYMHSGGQYNAFPEDYTIKLTDYIIECGVDIVIGMHPHVVHGIKKYDNAIMGVYSLGNLYAKPYANRNQSNDLPNYSIILNLYFDEEEHKLHKITFSVTKSIEKDNKVFVKLVNDLLKKEDTNTEKQAKQIIKNFLGEEVLKIKDEIVIGGICEQK